MKQPIPPIGGDLMLEEMARRAEAENDEDLGALVQAICRIVINRRQCRRRQ